MPDGNPLRIALLAYRGNPHSGGQGVYVKNLSRALVDIGHSVTVFAGQPYPEVDPRVELRKVPSLDLFRDPDPFRVPKLREFRGPIDVLEFAMMCSATFPEPLTFSLRVRPILAREAGSFDVVHDNQCLGYGLLGLERAGVPLLATVHHAVTIDRRVQLQALTKLHHHFAYRRWYAFARMQSRVARRMPVVITVSDAAKDDLVRELKLRPERVRVVANGVDAAVFRPKPEVARIPGRILTTASADVPVKGLAFLLEALAKLRADRPERAPDLVVVGKPRPESRIPGEVQRLGLSGAVRFVHGIDDDALATEYAQAEVAVVPSLYEGFSLPAVEAMACGVPLVATTGGALPEVAGPDGQTSIHVTPGDAGALAAGIGRLLDDEGLRSRIGAAGRQRALDLYTWRRAAEITASHYRDVIARRRIGEAADLAPSIT